MRGLTLKQIEVLQLTADGLTAGQVATKLGKAQSTVKNSLTDIRQKLQATATVQAVAMAFRLGYLK